MLVHADRIEAALCRILELIHEIVVHEVRALRVEQRGVDVHPHRRILVPEIVRQFRVWHQVEPHQLHARSPLVLPTSIRSILSVSQPSVSGTNATCSTSRWVIPPVLSFVIRMSFWSPPWGPTGMIMRPPGAS